MLNCFVENGPTYNDHFKDDRNEAFPSFLEYVRCAVNNHAAERRFSIANGVDVNFAVVDEIFEALETELNDTLSDLT